MEKEKKKRPMRYNEAELFLLKNTFAENDDLIKAIQKVFLQLPLNALDLSILQLISGNKEINKIIRKVVLPQLDDDVPYGEVWDYQLAIDFRSKMPENIVADIKANKILIDYFDQQLKVLEKADFRKEPKIKLAELADITDKIPNDIYIDILARSNIIGTFASRLVMLAGLAGEKVESPEEQKRRLEQDSSK
jgi:hypothetical protein